jgi:hypothetical protein
MEQVDGRWHGHVGPYSAGAERLWVIRVVVGGSVFRPSRTALPLP